MAHSYVASIDDGLSCCVCFELFVDPHTPKDLNCPHVICQVCLKRLMKGRAIDCPQCRLVTRVPEKGVAALKTNLGIRNLAETHQRHAQKQKKDQQIQSSLSTISHRAKVPICPDHDEQMHFYCSTCHIFVCRACTVINHKQPQHQIQEVKVLHREQMQQLNATITKLEQDALICEKKSREIGRTKQQILSSIQAEETKIDRALELLMEKACAESDDLKAEIQRKIEPKLKQCQEGETSLQKRAEELQGAVTNARVVMTVTSSHDFVIQHKSLMDKLTATGPSHEEQIQYQPGEVEFKAEQVTLKLGTITIKQEGRQPVARKKNTDGLALKLNPIPAVLHGFHHCMWSIASNRAGDILAISEGIGTQAAVHTYSKQSNGQYKKKSSLNVTGSKFNGSQNCYVTIAPDERYFVANDRRIHMYSQSGRYQRVCNTAREGANLTYISTMTDGRIIAGDYRYKNRENGITLLSHTPDGIHVVTQIKKINTSIPPARITTINNTHVAIYQQDAETVSVIYLESGAETLSIDIDDNPRSVCYDEETDSLLIAHGHVGQCVIDQYSLSTGGKITRITESLFYPSAMIFAGVGMLAVTDDKVVKLYTVGY